MIQTEKEKAKKKIIAQRYYQKNKEKISAKKKIYSLRKSR